MEEGENSETLDFLARPVCTSTGIGISFFPQQQQVGRWCPVRQFAHAVSVTECGLQGGAWVLDSLLYHGAFSGATCRREGPQGLCRDSPSPLREERDPEAPGKCRLARNPETYAQTGWAVSLPARSCPGRDCHCQRLWRSCHRLLPRTGCGREGNKLSNGSALWQETP